MSREKPPAPRDPESTLGEGTLYKLFRTGAIWMNKLFFSSFALLSIWLLLGLAGQVEPGCADSYEVVPDGNGTGDRPDVECSVWLSTTAKYLGAMGVISFILSVGLGLLGLVVGKQALPVTPADPEVGGDRLDGDKPGHEEE